MVKNLFRVRIDKMPHLDQVVLSRNYRFVFLRNKNKFFINYTKMLEEKIMGNKKLNDSFRELNY